MSLSEGFESFITQQVEEVSKLRLEYDYHQLDFKSVYAVNIQN